MAVRLVDWLRTFLKLCRHLRVFERKFRDFCLSSVIFSLKRFYFRLKLVRSYFNRHIDNLFNYLFDWFFDDLFDDFLYWFFDNFLDYLFDRLLFLKLFFKTGNLFQILCYP